MTDPAIVATICAIPRRCRHGDKSPSQLVADSGYPAVRGTLTQSEILEQLTPEPSLVEEWADWSQDKRTSEGWYLSLRGDGGSIGYVGRTDPELSYMSRAAACAQFILREVADIDFSDPERDRTT